MAGGDGLWWWCSRFRQLVGLPAWCWDVVWIAAYYAIGVLVLAKREGWLYNETIYFLSVTVATVGYGDYSPRTYGGRWFVAVYAPLGVAMVFSTIARHVMTLQSRMRKMTMVLFGVLRLRNAEEERGLPIEEFSPRDVRGRVHYWQRYLACLAPVLTFTLGNTALARFTLGISWSNAVYYASSPARRSATATSAGSRTRRAGRGASSPCTRSSTWPSSRRRSTSASSCGTGSASRRARRRSRARELEEMLLLKFARLKQRDVDHGVDPELTEADYIVRTLLNGQFVDPQLLVAIQRAFYWTALGGDGERSTISVDDVHEEHRAEARRRSLTVEHLNFVGEKPFTASGHSLRDLRQYAATHDQDKPAGAATTGTPRCIPMGFEAALASDAEQAQLVALRKALNAVPPLPGPALDDDLCLLRFLRGYAREKEPLRAAAAAFEAMVHTGAGLVRRLGWSKDGLHPVTLCLIHKYDVSGVLRSKLGDDLLAFQRYVDEYWLLELHRLSVAAGRVVGRVELVYTADMKLNHFGIRAVRFFPKILAGSKHFPESARRIVSIGNNKVAVALYQRVIRPFVPAHTARS
ncbi:potassium channel [Aureococcus anophagefferens]|nr:potassium channel [Aureococcus anophagefferens]